MISHPLKEISRHFIDSNGKVYQIVAGKEVELLPKQSKKTKRLYFIFEKKTYDYLNLMLKYFHPVIKATDKIKYKIKDGKISAACIKIKPFIGKYADKIDETKEHEYGCIIKANSSNARCIDKLTSMQVFTTLKIHDYKCVYCQVLLHPTNWHLDHYHPLAQGGKNVFENIVPSCPMCNTMKGALTGEQFYKRCHVITNQFLFKESYFDHSKATK